MLTNIKSESNAPFLKSPPLAHKTIFFEKSQHLRQKWMPKCTQYIIIYLIHDYIMETAY